MKAKKILNMMVVLSYVHSADTKKPPFVTLSNEKFANQVLSDTRSIRKIREYDSHSEQEKVEYDKKVTVIADSFCHQRSLDEKWNETKAILDIHETALENNYPNIKPIDDAWEAGVKNDLLKSHLLADMLYAIPKETFLTEYEEQKYFSEPLKGSAGTIKRLIADNSIKILIDDDVIVQMLEDNIKQRDSISIYRTPMIQGAFSKYNQDEYPQRLNGYKSLFRSVQTIEKHINIIANKLLDGEFSNQQEAIDLLLDYKILSCLPFAIQDQLGTQFKNIIKINYLTEAIKHKYPRKIDKNLKIPHITDYESFEQTPLLRSPEIAIVALTPSKFKEIQLQQIEQELKNQHKEL